jgi:hypothetical protein
MVSIVAVADAHIARIPRIGRKRSECAFEIPRVEGVEELDHDADPVGLTRCQNWRLFRDGRSCA